MGVRPDDGIFLEEANRSDTRIVDVGPMHFAAFDGFAEVQATCTGKRPAHTAGRCGPPANRRLLPEGRCTG